MEISDGDWNNMTIMYTKYRNSSWNDSFPTCLSLVQFYSPPSGCDISRPSCLWRLGRMWCSVFLSNNLGIQFLMVKAGLGWTWSWFRFLSWLGPTHCPDLSPAWVSPCQNRRENLIKNIIMEIIYLIIFHWHIFYHDNSVYQVYYTCKISRGKPVC